MKTKQIITMVLIALCGMAQAALVTIGNAGNAADGTTGYGAVGYTYQISATEVTIAEFTASGAGNGNENYWDDVGQGTSVGPSAPVSYVSLYEAMKYCNYLTSGNILLGAYQFSDGLYQSTDRASAITTYGTVYALPTEDEWYKAAYYTGSGYSLYANGTDTAPGIETDANYDGTGGTYPGMWAVGTGTMEQNRTFDMMGNIWEWMESSSGVFRGGGFFDDESYLRSSYRDTSFPTEYEGNDGGFRIVAIPEPATALLLAIGGGLVWLARLKQRF